MPRNSSGTYTLVAGNPVIADSLIETGWANPTLSDIAQALSDSLDRYGRGSMLAPLKFADGTVAAPGIAFSSESSTGFYHPSAQVLGLTVGGTQITQWEPNLVTLLQPTKLKIAGTDVFTVDAAAATLSVPLTSTAAISSSSTISAAPPTDAGHVTTKGYVDNLFSSAAGGGYLPLAGGKLTGALTIEANQYAQFILSTPDAAANQKIAKIYKATNGVLSFVTTNDAGSAEQTGFRINTDGNLVNVAGYKFWHSGNMGAGSTLNADLTDGYHVNEGPVASTIVARDVNKNIQANLLYGGAGSAGTLYTHGGGGSVNFRWDGTNLFYRVNEAVDRLISTTATFAWSQADPGYLQVGPIIIQWGSANVNIDSSVTVNLAKPWSYCVNAVASPNINANQTGTSIVSANVLWVSATQITVGVGDQSWSGSVPVRWIAIGW